MKPEPLDADTLGAAQEAIAQQELEVISNNEKIWRRNLLYQTPVLLLFRDLVDFKMAQALQRLAMQEQSDAALAAAADDGAGALASVSLDRGLVETGYMLFEKAVLHSEDMVTARKG